jgi:hypothetical protein
MTRPGMTPDSQPEDFASVPDIEKLLAQMAPARTPAEALGLAPTIKTPAEERGLAGAAPASAGDPAGARGHDRQRPTADATGPSRVFCGFNGGDAGRPWQRALGHRMELKTGFPAFPGECKPKRWSDTGREC